MKLPRSTLEQWAVLQTVIDEGSFAKAAAKLHKSQSAVSYTISTLEEQLGIELLVQQGRRAVLTEVGKILLNRSRELSRLITDIEKSVTNVRLGYESHLSLVVDALYPRDSICKVIKAFEQENDETKLDIRFEILSGPINALISGEADLVITPHVPKGFFGETLCNIQIRAYAQADSPLHRLPGKISARDLKKERYITIRDRTASDERSDGWFGSERTYRVDSFDAAKALLLSGVGFAWLPDHMVKGSEKWLKPLSLATGGARTYAMHLIQRDQEIPGPARQLLMRLLREYSAA